MLASYTTAAGQQVPTICLFLIFQHCAIIMGLLQTELMSSSIYQEHFTYGI